MLWLNVSMHWVEFKLNQELHIVCEQLLIKMFYFSYVPLLALFISLTFHLSRTFSLPNKMVCVLSYYSIICIFNHVAMNWNDWPNGHRSMIESVLILAMSHVYRPVKLVGITFNASINKIKSTLKWKCSSFFIFCWKPLGVCCGVMLLQLNLSNCISPGGTYLLGLVFQAYIFKYIYIYSPAIFLSTLFFPVSFCWAWLPQAWCWTFEQTTGKAASRAGKHV